MLLVSIYNQSFRYKLVDQSIFLSIQYRIYSSATLLLKRCKTQDIHVKRLKCPYSSSF